MHALEPITLQVFKRNIPINQNLSEEHNWLVGAFSAADSNLQLTIQRTESSKTFFHDRESYVKFTATFKTTVGSWNGTTGYWLTAKLFQETIICSDYKQLKTGRAESAKSVLLNKKADETFISVHVNSTVIGSLDFECSGLRYKGAKEIALVNSDTRQWEWYTDALDRDSCFRS
jgi:hypothetical protein